jgi:hypothetical protein
VENGKVVLRVVRNPVVDVVVADRVHVAPPDRRISLSLLAPADSSRGLGRQPFPARKKAAGTAAAFLDPPGESVAPADHQW